MNKVNLNEGWLLRHEELHWGPEKHTAVALQADGWLPANVPCDIHMPLIAAGIIKEPLEGTNCIDCEWTEQKSWWFKKVFHTDKEMMDHEIIELTLESLDSEADIYLNGAHLGHHRSAFYPFTKDVRSMLRSGQNELLVRLTSGVEYYSDQDFAGLKNSVGAEMIYNRGDRRRIFVRKPQFSYGWDWGPRVATCGIMKDVYLEGYNQLTVRAVRGFTRHISPVSGEAELAFEVEIEQFHDFSTLNAQVELKVIDGLDTVLSIHKELPLRSGLNYIDAIGAIQNAKLWWPNGMGEQPLYSIQVSVITGAKQVSYPEFKLGIRMVEINQAVINSDERLFAIQINGVRTFCKGGNWIPADSIYARVTDEKYDALVHEAKNANFNMLRIWGGGIYEPNIFYEKCDEYGIMIWHDFMFACAGYPDHLDWFRGEVEQEIDYQTRRLRNHPSIVLWSGNNENTWGFDEWWVGERKLPFYGGARCYNEIAPRTVRRNCPDIPYWNSSPYGGEHPNGNEMGDRHHWFDCTMNPDMEKRITPEEYDKVTSKFVSEYGYIGPCRESSIQAYHGDNPVVRYGDIWNMHNNTFEKATVPAGITKHYANADSLELDQYLLYAGLCQGLMLGYSLEALRFKEQCSGGLFWMYNDCWGEVGWTIIDYYLKRKISYYFVRRAFAPVKLIIREVDGAVRVMGINETSKIISFQADYGYRSFDGTVVETKRETFELQPYTRVELLEFKRGEFDQLRGCYFIQPDTASLQGVDALPAAILRKSNFKELDKQRAEVKLSNFTISGSSASFDVSSDTYAHAVHFNLDERLQLSDEYFDLLPGESRRVTVYNVPDNFRSSQVSLISL